MKFLLFLCVFVSLIAVNLADIPNTSDILVRANPNNTCEATIECAQEGDSCNTTAACHLANSTCCALGLQCKNDSCMTDNIGGYCKVATDCFSSYYSMPYGSHYRCHDNECVYVYLPGDECENDYDCLTNSCNNETDTCDGMKAGEKCNVGECEYGYSCISGICSALGSNGSQCAYASQCALGLTCSSKKCIEKYSLAEGASCTVGSVDECNEDDVCLNGKCVSGQEWTQTSCDSDSECPSGQDCWCSKASGDQFCLPNNTANFTNSAEGSKDYWDCIRDNNCTTDSTAPNSCAQQNCGSDYSDSIDFACDVNDSVFDSCYSNSNCGGFPLWAIIVIAVVAVILVLVVIVVVVMVVRKKNSREYDRIE